MEPLKKIIRTRTDGYGSFWELLECLHSMNSTDLRPALRRRCFKCAAGAPNDYNAWMEARR